MQQAKLVSLDSLASLIIKHFMSNKVFMMSDGFDEFLQESSIGDISWSQTFLVQHSYDSLVSLFHKVTDDLVVEVLHWLPLEGEKKTAIITKGPHPNSSSSLLPF